MWHFDQQTEFTEEELIDFLREYVKNGFRIYVGSDSQAVQERYVFATAVCLHHPTKKDGVCYFWTKEKHSRQKYISLNQRMLQEATLTLTVAQEIRENIPEAYIEVHFDVASDENTLQTRLQDLVTSYAKGFGFEYKIKPDAWAASGAADGHCKR